MSVHDRSSFKLHAVFIMKLRFRSPLRIELSDKLGGSFADEQFATLKSYKRAMWTQGVDKGLLCSVQLDGAFLSTSRRTVNMKEH